ncbi:hypothetical protein C4K88_13250 [Arthrobacter pityocampae]|uniref:Ferritin-like domain-containing protein n=1 Tax=Arthrobacter pityocampae TaxID=547334 RepID=A0A2S5IWA7_9MICC|nr:hypothetical protein C4K88_13250 [Arthrobacter pityocampae]
METANKWIAHFQANSDRHRALEAGIEWDVPATIDDKTRRGFVRSFQRFELGESGDGARLLSLAAAAGDPAYTKALELLVQEEQKHSALFLRVLKHLDAAPLESHWTDAAFTRLRRLLGLRTELGLFLIAESVAMEYFRALADRAPDPILRAVGRRVAEDEGNHIRFQIDRLRVGFCETPALARLFVGIGWSVVAAGAATVLVVDHGAALRACGISAPAYWGRATQNFLTAVQSVLVHPHAPLLGPAERPLSDVPDVR